MSSFTAEIEPRRHTYSRGSTILGIAAQWFGIEVSDEQVDRWRLLFHAMHDLDSILDGDASFSIRSAMYDEMLWVMAGNKHEGCNGCYACNLQPFTANAPDSLLEKFVVNADRIRYLGEERRSASKVRDLGHIAIEEGKLSAELLELESVSQKEISFNNWLGDLGIAGTLLDTAIDLSSDYEIGLTQVSPAIRNKLALVTMSLPYVTKVARHINVSVSHSFTKAFFAANEDQTKDLIQQEV